MKVSCLMPTFNRYPYLRHLVEEAVESFLRQDYEDKELIICNDTPGQLLEWTDSKIDNVRVYNASTRFPTLSDKINFMIDMARGDLLCRWDDDDISLPHRLSYSIAKLGDRLEWRADNYYYDPGTLHRIAGAGNSHITSVWRRELLDKIGGYPPGLSGSEDQAFNQRLIDIGMNESYRGIAIPDTDIYYIYRWNTGGQHLSGSGDGDPKNPHQSNYDRIGQMPRTPGTFPIIPRWRVNHLARVRQYLHRPSPLERKDPLKIQNQFFNYKQFYDWVVGQVSNHSTLVEVGCLGGSSLCYLANLARERQAGISVVGVDIGIGAYEELGEYEDTPALLTNIRECGVQDITTLIVDESTKASRLFADESLDFVFIDAEHSYHTVRSDLQAWFPKVKRGGIIAGHDYNNPHFQGVHKAVDQFFRMPTGTLKAPLSDSCWMFRK